MAKEKNSVIDRIISFLEKERFNLLTIFLWIFLLAAVRMWTETQLFDQKLGYTYIFMHAHIISFFFAVFVGGILILKFFSKEKLGKIANLTAWGFTIILLPPLLDFFVFGRSSSYWYIPREKFLDAFTSFFYNLYPDVGGIGLMLEMIAILAFTTLYVFLKTRSLRRAVMNFFVFYLFIFFVTTPSLNPLLDKWLVDFSAYLPQPILFLWYFVLSLIFLLLLIMVSKKGLLPTFIRSTRSLITLHFVLMAFIGVLIAGHLNIDLMNITSPFHAGNIGTLGVSLFTVVFGWQYVMMINYVYDLEIDKMTNKSRLLPKGMLTASQVKKISILCAIISIGLATLLGVYTVLLVVFGLFLGTIYSVPPIRLRNIMFATIVIGIGSSIAFFIGYFTPSYEVRLSMYIYEIVKSTPALTMGALGVGLLIFITLSIGPLVKDLKDYEGDKKSGVRNIFTVYGKEKGIKIASALLFVTFLAPLILFHKYYDPLVFIPLGVIAAIIFKKFEKVQLIFLLYFSVLFYCLVRWFNFV